MLKGQYDYVILGTDYLAYLLGLNLIEKGASVCIIEQDQIKLGEHYANTIGQLEFEYLKTWGSIDHLVPIENLNQYAKEEKILFKINGRQLLLGHSPYQNLLELFRKLPTVFKDKNLLMTIDQDNFDKSYFEMAKRMAEWAFHRIDQHKTKKNAYQSGEEFLIHNFQQNFVSEFLNTNDLDRQMLLSVAQWYFYSHLSDISNSDLLHQLFFHLISPRYQIESTRLISDLKSIFLSKGGGARSSKVVSMEFIEKKISSVELSSFEGRLTPKGIFILSAQLADLPLSFSFNQPLYGAVAGRCKFANSVWSDYIGHSFVSSGEPWFGTSLPVISYRVENDQELSFRFLYEVRAGLNPQVFYDRSKDRLLDDISSYIPTHFNKAHLSWEFFEDPELWPVLVNESKKDVPSIQHLYFQDEYTPKHLAHGVEIVGNLNSNGLGLLSSFQLCRMMDRNLFLK